MKVLVAGDFVPRYNVANQIEKGDFSCLKEIASLATEADYSVLNFEAPVVSHDAAPIHKTGPHLKCTREAMKCVSESGFNCVTLANNHFKDYGQVGIEDTLSACNEFHLDFVGGGMNLTEAGKVLSVAIRGERLAVINACEHEWSVATKDEPGANPIDIVAICNSIKSAKKESDYVLLIVHGGTEMYNLPSPRMKRLYRFFIDEGADAIVNHHQHCYSGYEEYKGKPIIYGLGNLCFADPFVREKDLWSKGYVAMLEFSEHITFQLFPYEQCSCSTSGVNLLWDKKSFDQQILSLNSIIRDDELLEEHFRHMSNKAIGTVRVLLNPYSSKVARTLLNKNCLPNFATCKRKSQLRALVQCESHRDVLLELLNQ